MKVLHPVHDRLIRVRFSSTCLSLIFLCTLLSPLGAGVSPVQAQSASSVIDEMKMRYQDQFTDVDHFVVETNVSTTYYRKIDSEEGPRFEVATARSEALPYGGEEMELSPSASQYKHLDRMATHARHDGFETIRGQRSHRLVVDDPQKIDADFGAEAERLTWYVDAATYQIARMSLQMRPQSDEMGPMAMTIDLSDYRTEQGITLPWMMEMNMDLSEALSPKMKKQMEEMQKQLADMPEAQRKRMERMMGDQMQSHLQSMMNREPIVITVQRVGVNEGLPEGVFSTPAS